MTATRPTEAAGHAQGAADDHELVRSFTLTIVSGPGAPQSFQSSGERVLIGTAEPAKIILEDRTVSRLHCEIFHDGGRVRIRDLGSRNATLVNGVSVLDAHLRGGEVLTLGTTQLQFDLGFDHVKVPLSRRDSFGALVGSSSSMRRVYELLERAAASDVTVLLEGETGTGKEAAAESIHRESARAGGPFVIVDCGAIPPDLLESELFGHEKGAFTGAHAARQGAFEAAGGGTLFLDEIGELAAALQPKLLRVLERKEIKRVGNPRYMPVDVRVVAATNRDLCVEVNAQRFRSDLYYRLAVLEVKLPPLRERTGDLAALARRLLAGMGAPPEEAAKLCAPTFVEVLARHSWPGNVRELRNYLERCVALRGEAPLPRVTVREPAPHAAEQDRLAALEAAVAALSAGRAGAPAERATPAAPASAGDGELTMDRESLVRALGEHGGHIGKTAASLGVHRRTLERRLKKLGLRGS